MYPPADCTESYAVALHILAGVFMLARRSVVVVQCLNMAKLHRQSICLATKNDNRQANIYVHCSHLAFPFPTIYDTNTYGKFITKTEHTTFANAPTPATTKTTRSAYSENKHTIFFPRRLLLDGYLWSLLVQ